MAEERIENWANSAILKLVGCMITAIALPIIAWFMNGTLNRLDKIEAAVQRGDTDRATVELRLSALERSRIDRDVQMKLITEKLIGHEYELRALQQPTRR